MQCAAPAFIAAREEALPRFPGEAVDRRHETLLGGKVGQIADLHHGILRMGRDDLQILFVEGDKLQL